MLKLTLITTGFCIETGHDVSYFALPFIGEGEVNRNSMTESQLLRINASEPGPNGPRCVC